MYYSQTGGPMPMSVRLDPETEALIKRLARSAGRSKSWVVREAVAAYSHGTTSRRPPYEAMAPFIGVGGVGGQDLSERTGERFSALVRKKARGRRAR
jgi:hypothetical protein